MVDEDFVMGYVVGYNDGIGSGGGGGDVPTGDTVIYNDLTIAKQWNLTGTPFGIALFDVHSDRLVCGSRGVKVRSSIENWDRLWVYYWVAMGLMYNGDIVTVNPLSAISDALALNGTPYMTEWTNEIKSIGGTATLNHKSTTSSSGDVTHTFSATIKPSAEIHEIEYYHNEIKSETDKTTQIPSFDVLSWKFTVATDGTKSISSYDSYWFFIPTASSSSSGAYIEKGIAGVPRGTSTQQLFQTGMLFETLKESLLNAGENVTLEEV